QKVAEHIAGFRIWLPRVDTRGARAKNLRPRRRQFLYARDVPGAGVDEPGVGIERDWYGVGTARRPDLDLFTREKALVDVRQDRTARGKVDVCGPVHFDVRMGRDEFAVRSVEHIHESVLVGLDHDFPKLTTDLDIRKDVLVVAVYVVDIIGR